MIYTVQIGMAELKIRTHEIPEDEMQGGFEARFDLDAVRALQGWNLEITGSDNGKLIQDRGTGLEGLVIDADHFIAALSALGDIGGSYTLEWMGYSIFWLFHDLSHARNDYHSCSDSKTVYVEGIEEYTEMEAHSNGLAEYLRNGGNAREAVQEIMKSAEIFKNRFSPTWMQSIY